MVSELTERLFAGDVTALVSHLLAARDMSRDDRARERDDREHELIEGRRSMIETLSPT